MVRQLDRVPNVVNVAVNAGANAVRGVQYSVEDPSAAVAQARVIALRNATTRARELASNAGVYLERILGVTEDAPQIIPGGVVAAQPREVQVGVTVTSQYGLYRFSPFSRVLPPLF